jgi:hypothetical protein
MITVANRFAGGVDGYKVENPNLTVPTYECTVAGCGVVTRSLKQEWRKFFLFGSQNSPFPEAVGLARITAVSPATPAGGVKYGHMRCSAVNPLCPLVGKKDGSVAYSLMLGGKAVASKASLVFLHGP